jgi:glycerol kinase
MIDRHSGEPLGPALGWQDLRTVIDCLVLQGSGLRLAPNQSATKAQWLRNNYGANRDVLFATLDGFLIHALSGGHSFVTDHSNVAVSGLVGTNLNYDSSVLEALAIRRDELADIVPTAGAVGRAHLLPGSPEIVAVIGDQPASLFGQNAVFPGDTKITFGTGTMLDQIRSTTGPSEMLRFDSGCFPTVMRSDSSEIWWGLEGICLSAGTCIDWLRDDLRIIDDVRDSDTIARSIPDNGGVSFVPAFLGLGTPQWDFGARGAFFGLTRGSTRAHLVRAVLDGIAHNAVDLIDATEAETGLRPATVRVDGGISRNQFVVQTLADASGCRVEVSGETEATTRGAGLMAHVATGSLSLTDVSRLWEPAEVYEPLIDEATRIQQRAQWAEMVSKASRTIPDLSAVSF